MEARRTSTIMGTKPKTHITDPTQDAPEGASWTLCGLFVLSKQVDGAHPSPAQKCDSGRPSLQTLHRKAVS